MESIYNLQKRASELMSKTETDSISPKEVGGLHADTLAYIADMEQSADGLGIRKVYQTKAKMEADTAPMGMNGKALRYGQLVSIYNEADKTSDENGDIYAWQKPGWLKMGNIGNIYELKAKIEELGTWLITHNNVTTLDALNQELNAFDAKTAQGLHRVKCWGIPLLVTFAILNVDDNVFMQTICGSLTVESDGSGIASIDSIGQHAIFVRYYNNGIWNSWGRYGAIPQDGVEGTSKHYVYSSPSDRTRTVLSSKMWTYTHTDGNLFLRFKKWGANNDTAQQDVCQVKLTGRVSNNRWGLMNPYVYARLNNHTLTEGQSTLDAVKVNYTRFDDTGNKVLTLTKATTAKAGVMTAEDKTRLDSLYPITQGFSQWLTTHKNVTTLDALNAALDAMNVDTTQGLHCFKCFGIPVLTYFGVLMVDTKLYVQIAVGAFTLNTDATALASINNTASTRNVIVRYFNGTKWQAWQPLQPQKQTSCAGNSGNYVFSEGTDDSTRTILSSKLWIYQHGDYNQFLRFKKWGATNDTKEQDYSQVMLPNAWTGGNGLLRYDIYRRLDAFELREQNSTATEVKIITPIFTTGGTRELSISKATTAKAGVMTAEDKTKLDELGYISAGGARAANRLNVAVGNRKLFGPENIFDTNNANLGGKVPKSMYDSSTLEEYTKGSPFQVFCTQGIKSDIHSAKYMIWFGLRKSATNIARYSSEQVIGQTEDELYGYGNPVAFWLSDGRVYYPRKGSSGLEIDADTSYLLSDDTPYIMTFADMRLLYQIKQKLNL